MNKQFGGGASRRKRLLTVGIVAILLIAVVFLWIGGRDSIQAEAPIIAGVTFEGEYRIGGGEWKPIVKGEHISSTQGDVTLLGFFQMHDPFTDEPVGPLSPGITVSLYLNHLRGTISTPTGESIVFDAENEVLQEDACAVMLTSFTVPSYSPITIVLHNPHRFGNENAVDEFLENISAAPGTYMELEALEKGSTERNVGLFILISSLIILGIATFSSVIHIKYASVIWLIGLMSVFAGGYFSFDAFGVSLWNASNIVNTRALGLCMMFYMLFCTATISLLLKNKKRNVAIAAVAISGMLILACMLAPFLGVAFFFDTWLVWAIGESVAVLILAICLILSLRGSSPVEKIPISAGLLTLAAFLADFLATYFGLWEGGFLSKRVFLAVFTMTLVIVLRIIPSHINAAIKARELEAEQQSLKLALQESRISIMLSQMQPHFIFNTLNTIYHLCEINPDTARSTISSFSEYLRNNIDNLGRSEMISFEKELSFVKTYLDIEKVRFDDELEILFDVKTTNFKLPVLTVQPLVENAVKHGTSKKDGVATVCISSRETDDAYEIVISDTGVGFDASAYQSDGHKHIGISNVQQRLENLCNGTLLIESELGKGTIATVKIPKKEKKSA